MKLSDFLINLRYAFRPRKPMAVARVANAFIKSKVFGRPPLRYVDFSIRQECNLKCAHCFATAFTDDTRPRMTPKDYFRVAGECMALGAVNFSFQGGEPLMFKELPDIIAACRPHKNLISVTTNGTLLDEKRVAELKKIGVDIFTVSLDSSIPEEHDGFRGMKGAFARAVEGIKIARRAGINVTLGSVVTHHTLKSEGIKGLMKMAEEMKIILNIIFPVPAGRWSRENDNMLLTPDDVAHIESLTSRSRYIRTDFQGNLGRRGCGAAKEILYLTPYGDVLTCPFIHISFGNIFEESVKTIRDRALRNSYFKDYAPNCLASTDEDFVKKYIRRTLLAPKIPMSWRDAFGRDVE
ncbi:MAG: radical SAM protein [Endomicrobiia bacterium]|nr:radical SAM protein [Endomicrobiia bacterium]